ncbi:MAG: outer membrane lipoprotein-sorting protein [Acidobacteria bacterium]|nr:outer membrane lipoprotein-sorting protein [Acidobacteriota bacterium]
MHYKTLSQRGFPSLVVLPAQTCTRDRIDNLSYLKQSPHYFERLRGGPGMRSTVIVFFVLFVLASTIGSAPLTAQESPQRDPRALSLVAQSLAAMGGVVPSDSVASGRIELVAGSTTDSGRIRILTRGVDQTAEQIQTSEASRTIAYSRRQAAEQEGATRKGYSLELAVSSQSAAFPLTLLAAALNNPETAFYYLDVETVEGVAAHRIRFWNSFASKPRFQYLAAFTVTDLWIDAASGLPVKLSYERRAAFGAEGAIPVDVYYSGYRNVGGVLYPFLIKKSFNGTPWATIAIENVVLNQGLTDADFPVESEGGGL